MLADLQPVDLRAREPITSEVARRLLDYLLSGKIQPGERMPSERKLAEALGVGRSIIREALKSLTVLGLIDVRQGDGTYLKRTDSPILPLAIEWGLMLGAKRATDLVEARHHIEVVLAGLAAEHCDAETIEAMRHSVQLLEEAADSDPDGFIAADLAFHLQLAQAAGNETLLQIMSSIRSLLQVWISRVVHSSPEPYPTADEHRTVFLAIERHDPAAAREAMEKHMAAATGRLRGALAENEASVGSTQAADA